MKYKFKAFGVPVLSILIFAICFLLASEFLHLNTSDGCGLDGYGCSEQAMFPEIGFPLYFIFNFSIFTKIIGFFVFLLIVNFIYGTKALKQEKEASLGNNEAGIKLIHTIKKIRLISGIISILVAIVLAITLVAIIPEDNPNYRGEIYGNCQPIYDSTTQTFITPPNCL